MRREKITAKIERIIQTIEDGATPSQVRQVWVFGSYRRGAEDCGDLDLGLVVDPPSDQWYEDRGLRSWDLDRWRSFTSAMTSSLKSRGERIDIHIVTREEHLQSFLQSVPVPDALLLWSIEDTDYREKLASIAVDPDAGRFKRDFPIDLKRTRTTREAMEDVMWLVSNERLILTEASIDGVTPQLSEDAERRIERAREFRLAGRKTLEVVPYAYDWLRREKQRIPQCKSVGDTEIISVSRTHLVHLGRINFGYALGWLFNDPKARKLCLIPHLRKRTANVMFIIERGPKWTGDHRELDARKRRS